MVKVVSIVADEIVLPVLNLYDEEYGMIKTLTVFVNLERLIILEIIRVDLKLRFINAELLVILHQSQLLKQTQTENITLIQFQPEITMFISIEDDLMQKVIHTYMTID
jgi:hypothetical protein